MTGEDRRSALPPRAGGRCGVSRRGPCGGAPWAPPPLPPPRNPPPPPKRPASPLAAVDDVALICVAVTVPPALLVPWTMTVSPGWMAPALAVAVRLIFEWLVVFTRTVLPSLSFT